MALVISVRVGTDFYVGDERVVLSWVDNPRRFGLTKPCGEVVIVEGDGWHDLLPGCKVCAGSHANKTSTRVIRIAISAPGVKVSRGSLLTKVACSSCHGRGFLETKVFCQYCRGMGCASCTKGYASHQFKCPDCS